LERERLTALSALNDRSHTIAGADPSGTIGKAQARIATTQVGTAGGTLAGLVGTYDEVAKRIEAFSEIGIELFMLQFHPFESEIRRFGEEVIPRVRGFAGGERLTHPTRKASAQEMGS
jgi:alkanesulfonate monooxygenase